MGNQDLKPTRLHCTLKLLESFIDEYFYLNPISQVRQLGRFPVDSVFQHKTFHTFLRLVLHIFKSDMSPYQLGIVTTSNKRAEMH